MKAQMRFQKVLALVTLVIAAVTFVYALCFMSGSLHYIQVYSVLNERNWPKDVDFGSVYDLAWTVNDLLFWLGLVAIIASVFLFITASNKRRNYYISNKVACIAVAAYFAVFALVAIILISLSLASFMSDIDFESYKAWVDASDGAYPDYSDSTAVFAIGYVIYVIVLANAAALILNLIWKLKLMQGEKALLERGLVKEVA